MERSAEFSVFHNINFDKVGNYYLRVQKHELFHFQCSDFIFLFVQLERYKELKEIARRKVATLTQQLGKLRWEQKADEERMKLYQRKKKEVKVFVSS